VVALQSQEEDSLRHSPEDQGAVSATVKNGKVDVVVAKEDGKQETITVEKVLASVGRKPNTGNLGLR
jgi:pyruvate/2-oxoglutarate dehydrogenase complex dihydrolipoamide dehydrogenase (E3) component